MRAYANLANEMTGADYTPDPADRIRREADHYEKVRQEEKVSSGDYMDMKSYEPAMRHLLDAYICADESKTISSFEDKGLVELLVERGRTALDELPDGIRQDKAAMSEAIENNIRKVMMVHLLESKHSDRFKALMDEVLPQWWLYHDELNQMPLAQEEWQS